MEQLVTTLETSEQLKAAGFPQDAYGAYYRKGHYWVGSEHVEATEPELMLYEGTNLDFPWMIVAVAPSAQEIADQLPTNWGKSHLIINKSEVVDTYVASYGRDFEAGPTLAEALGALYLHIHGVRS